MVCTWHSFRKQICAVWRVKASVSALGASEWRRQTRETVGICIAWPSLDSFGMTGIHTYDNRKLDNKYFCACHKIGWSVYSFAHCATYTQWPFQSLIKTYYSKMYTFIILNTYFTTSITKIHTRKKNRMKTEKWWERRDGRKIHFFVTYSFFPEEFRCTLYTQWDTQHLKMLWWLLLLLSLLFITQKYHYKTTKMTRS